MNIQQFQIIMVLVLLTAGLPGCGTEPHTMKPTSSPAAADRKLPEEPPKRTLTAPENVKADVVGGVAMEPGPAGIGGVVHRTTVQDIQLSWDSVAGAESYTIYWSTVPGVTIASRTPIRGVVSPHLHTNLEEGQSYYYVVTTSGIGVESPVSQEVSAQPGTGSLQFDVAEKGMWCGRFRMICVFRGSCLGLREPCSQAGGMP